MRDRVIVAAKAINHVKSCHFSRKVQRLVAWGQLVVVVVVGDGEQERWDGKEE